MIDLRQVRAFVTVVREGSFTRAALTLHYAQSSVTAQVKQLEAHLGSPLLDRVPGQLSLTAAGEQFLPYAQQLLALALEASDAVLADKEPSGRLTLSACESVLTYRLPNLLRTFQDRYPKVRVDLQPPGVCEAGPARDRNIDIAISICEKLEEPQLIAHAVLTEPVCAVVCADHTLAMKTSITANDIAAEQLLVTEDRGSYRRLFEASLAEAGVRAAKTLEFSSVEAIKQCAKARMGIGILPKMVVQEDIAQGRLAVLAWPSKRLEVCTQLVRRKEKWFSPAMRAFWSEAPTLIKKTSLQR